MKDVTQIRVGKNRIGIMGLEEAVADVAENHRDLPDEDKGKLLLEKLSKKNYIVERLSESYTQAFLREYKKHVGQPVEEESGEGIQIKVLGPGCTRCERMERDIIEVLAENGIVADVEHVRDLDEIGRYGVMGTPALIINGVVKIVGNVPSKSRMKSWLDDIEKELNDKCDRPGEGT